MTRKYGNEFRLTQSSHQEERAFRDVNFLYQLSQALTDSLDVDVIIDKVITLLQDHFNFYCVRVFFLEQIPSKGKTALVLRRSSECVRNSNDDRIEISEGIVGHVAMTCHLFVTNELRQVPFYKPNLELPFSAAELAVPLQASGTLLGVLDVHHRDPNQFKDRDSQLMMAIADQLTIAIEKGLLYADLQTTLLQEQATRAQLVQSEKLAALGRIVASVAHELNNPLQAIQNALYLLKTEETLTSQAKEDLQVALNEADRMAGLISRLRETYRPIGQEDFMPHSVNVLIYEVEKLLSTHLSTQT